MDTLFTPVSLNWADMLTRLGAACLCAGVLSIERYLRKKPVDFRPFIIISVVSAALMIAITEFATTATNETFSIDPAKVFNGILSGIGFLGAGALFRDKDVVRGAGSAAAIWASGAIGIICGLGFLWLAITISAIIIALLTLSDDMDNVHTMDNDN